MLLNINAIKYESQVSNYFTIGIDQGSSLWVMTILDRSTGKYSRHSFKGLNKEVECYKKIEEIVKLGRPTSVCYEAGRSGFTPARILTNFGCKVRVLPYNKLEIISSGKKAKTDKIDSQFLAEINPLDESIPTVWVPSVEQECLREMPREDRRLKKDICQNNNRIISILERWPVPKISTHQSSTDWEQLIKTWMETNAVPRLLPEMELRRIKLLVSELKQLEANLSEWCEFMQETEDQGRADAATENIKYCIDEMKKYKGIGDVISRSFFWELGDFFRFKNGKHISSYFGLTPTPFASGKMNREQGISKQGNSNLRRLSIQLAWLWYHWQPDSKITKKWSAQLKKKGRQRKTAIVAMARQLVVALYRDMVKGEPIEGAIIKG